MDAKNWMFFGSLAFFPMNADASLPEQSKVDDIPDARYLKIQKNFLPAIYDCASRCRDIASDTQTIYELLERNMTSGLSVVEISLLQKILYEEYEVSDSFKTHNDRDQILASYATGMLLDILGIVNLINGIENSKIELPPLKQQSLRVFSKSEFLKIISDLSGKCFNTLSFMSHSIFNHIFDLDSLGAPDKSLGYCVLRNTICLNERLLNSIALLTKTMVVLDPNVRQLEPKK